MATKPRKVRISWGEVSDTQVTVVSVERYENPGPQIIVFGLV